MFKLKLISAFLFLTFSNLVSAAVKEIGIPVVQNFERSVYNAGTQNWCIDQGENGVLYFGNNQGLLRFDGQFWDTFQMPNNSNVRSIHYSKKEHVLYVGAYNDFGYFSADSLGLTQYTSLKNLVPPNYQEFGDVWKIYEGPWGILFQAFEGIYIYNGIMTNKDIGHKFNIQSKDLDLLLAAF